MDLKVAGSLKAILKVDFFSCYVIARSRGRSKVLEEGGTFQINNLFMILLEILAKCIIAVHGNFNAWETCSTDFFSLFYYYYFFLQINCCEDKVLSKEG